MNILVVDDQSIITERISKLITEKYPGYSVSTALNSSDVSRLLEEGKEFELAFIDISLSDESGTDIANFLAGKLPSIKTVFISGSPEMVSDVFFSVRPFGFIDKPIRSEKLFKYIDAASSKETDGGKYYACKIRGKDIRIPYSDIIYIESGAKSLIFHKTDSDILKVAGLLEEAEKVLPAELFVRCHKSYIVNLKYVTDYSKMTLSLMDGSKIGVSRSRKEDFEGKYLAYKGLK